MEHSSRLLTEVSLLGLGSSFSLGSAILVYKMDSLSMKFGDPESDQNFRRSRLDLGICRQTLCSTSNDFVACVPLWLGNVAMLELELLLILEQNIISTLGKSLINGIIYLFPP